MPVLPNNKAQLSPGSPSPFLLFGGGECGGVGVGNGPLAQLSQTLGGSSRSLACLEGNGSFMKTRLDGTSTSSGGSS